MRTNKFKECAGQKFSRIYSFLFFLLLLLSSLSFIDNVSSNHACCILAYSTFSILEILSMNIFPYDHILQCPISINLLIVNVKHRMTAKYSMKNLAWKSVW